MKKKRYNKSMIMLVLLLTTVVLSIGLGPINSGPSQINSRETTIPIKSQEPHTSQIIVGESNGTIICNAPKDQEMWINYPYTQICSDGAGGAIMTWWENRTDTVSDWDIYAQRLGSNGKTQWKTNGTIICNATGDQEEATICQDGAGGAIIAWHDQRGSDLDIYAQRIASNGTTLWRPNGIVICNATDEQFWPEICCDENGSAVIVWMHKTTDIYAQKIAPDGITLWAKNGTVICNATDEQWLPQICCDGAGGAIFAWQDKRNGADFDIYAQRIDKNENTLWAKNGAVICNATTDQEYPEPVYGGDGDAIITWQDKRGPNEENIYAQRIDKMGNTLWTKNGTVICNATNHQIFPQIRTNGAGGAIIMWSDDRDGTVTGYDIYAQNIASDGSPLWKANGTLVCNALTSQQDPDICYDNAGGAIITWYDNRAGTDDIYAQKIASDGSPLWKANGTLICNAKSAQKAPQICSDRAGGAIIMWRDDRDGTVTGLDIYAQKIRPSRGGLYALGDDDDDDDDDELNILLIVLIISLVSVGALTIIIVVLIKRGIIDISKLKRK